MQLIHEEAMTTTAEPATQAQAKKPSDIALFRQSLEGGMKNEIAKVLPKEIDTDRFIRTTITAVQMNPELLYADRRSLIASCMRAAQDGLLPDGREAVLNIYKTKVKGQGGRDEWIPVVQYLPMVRGLIKTIRNSGEVAHIDAAAVYERDEFSFERGDAPRLCHKPYLGEEDPGKIMAAYVVVRLNNGEVHREVMPRRDLLKVRSASKASGENSPWAKWEDQMSIKSVIKRAEKLLPTSSDRLARVIEHDNEAMGFDGFNQRGTELVLEAQQQAPAIADQSATSAPVIARPSRMAGIIGKAKAGQPVERVTDAQQAAAGLPADHASQSQECPPPWEEDNGGQQQAA